MTGKDNTASDGDDNSINRRTQKRIQSKLDQIIHILHMDAQADGAHHKMWCLDQIARVALGSEYHRWVRDYEAGDPNDPDDCYEWDTGIAP